MKKKLIHIPPGGLDLNLLYQLEEERNRNKRGWKIVDPIGLDLTKEPRLLEEEEPIPDIFEDDLPHLGPWDEAEEATAAPKPPEQGANISAIQE